MPYKHIAAHLKKTELACRLHYHQLSHGSNRRKRTNSVTSSGTGSVAQSPIMQHSLPSPINENMAPMSPMSYNYSPQASPVHVQLPSASTLLHGTGLNSPPRTAHQPVAILPKPSPIRRALSDSAANAPLRLDCGLATGHVGVSNVDKERLRQVYEAHRVSFWGLVASEYGGGASPFLLEEAWKRSAATNAPPTPCVSPDSQNIHSGSYQGYHATSLHQLPTPVQETKNATSISALLGIVSLIKFLCNCLANKFTGCQPTQPKGARDDQAHGGTTRYSGCDYGRHRQWPALRVTGFLAELSTFGILRVVRCLVLFNDGW